MQPTGDWLNQPGGLAERLYAMRKAAGLTGEAMAAALNWQKSKISKLENGRQMPSAGDLRAWADLCGQPEMLSELLDLLSAAQVIHRQHRRRGHAALQQDVDALVRRAKRIRNFEVALIPGLLQTAGYARCRALEVAHLNGTGEDGIDTVVAGWMKRQEVLYEPGRTFEFILTEAALRFRLAPADAMAGQLDRLANLSELGNITLAVIPFAAELPVTPLHGFMLADDVAYIETFASDQVLSPGESAEYGPIADALLAEAVGGDEARRLIAQAAR